MWDGTVINGRSFPAAIYERWRGTTVFTDTTWP
jgi:hypothetical protein